MARLKFIAPLLMAGAAATAIAAAPVATADAYAAATGTSSITIPASPGGDGCANGVCGSGDASGGFHFACSKVCKYTVLDETVYYGIKCDGV